MLMAFLIAISVSVSTSNVEGFLERCDPYQCTDGAPTESLDSRSEQHAVDCIAAGMWREYTREFDGDRMSPGCPPVFLTCDEANRPLPGEDEYGPEEEEESEGSEGEEEMLGECRRVAKNMYCGGTRKAIGDHPFGFGMEAEECAAAVREDPECTAFFDYSSEYNGQCKCATTSRGSELIPLDGYSVYHCEGMDSAVTTTGNIDYMTTTDSAEYTTEGFAEGSLAMNAEDGSRMTQFGSGCCRFDNGINKGAEGFKTRHECLQQCLDDPYCIAADIAHPRRNLYECNLFYQEGTDLTMTGTSFHTECNTASPMEMCFRKETKAMVRPAPKARRCDWSEEIVNRYIPGCSNGCASYNNQYDAMMACQEEPTCGGVTMQNAKFQLRRGPGLGISPTLEHSWVCEVSTQRHQRQAQRRRRQAAEAGVTAVPAAVVSPAAVPARSASAVAPWPFSSHAPALLPSRGPSPAEPEAPSDGLAVTAATVEVTPFPSARALGVDWRRSGSPSTWQVPPVPPPTWKAKRSRRYSGPPPPMPMPEDVLGECRLEADTVDKFHQAREVVPRVLPKFVLFCFIKALFMVPTVILGCCGFCMGKDLYFTMSRGYAQVGAPQQQQHGFQFPQFHPQVAMQPAFGVVLGPGGEQQMVQPLMLQSPPSYSTVSAPGDSTPGRFQPLAVPQLVAQAETVEMQPVASQ